MKNTKNMAATDVTVDGVTLTTTGDDFVSGGDLIVVAEDKSESPAAAGTYTLPDGRVITVTADGVIETITEIAATEEVVEAAAEGATEDVAADAATTEEVVAEDAATADDEATTTDAEVLDLVAFAAEMRTSLEAVITRLNALETSKSEEPAYFSVIKEKNNELEKQLAGLTIKLENIAGAKTKTALSMSATYTPPAPPKKVDPKSAHADRMAEMRAEALAKKNAGK